MHGNSFNFVSFAVDGNKPLREDFNQTQTRCKIERFFFFVVYFVTSRDFFIVVSIRLGPIIDEI